MRLRNNILILITLLLVFATVTTVVFLTIPDERLDQPVFWIGWSFAVPWALVAAIIMHIWVVRTTGNDIVHMTIGYSLVAIFTAAYAIVGIILMYCPIKAVTFPVIVEIVLTVGYIIASFYFTSGADYISTIQRETKKKVLFIRLLTADVEDCIRKAQTPAVRCALEKFADDVRASDPMSNDVLSGIEQTISSIVSEIMHTVAYAEEQQILALIEKGAQELEARNRRCLALK